MHFRFLSLTHNKGKRKERDLAEGTQSPSMKGNPHEDVFCVTSCSPNKHQKHKVNELN
jgi:hypothetical protein